MDLITKGRMTAKVQSKVVEFLSVVKLIESLLLFAVNTLYYYNYKPDIRTFSLVRKAWEHFLRCLSVRGFTNHPAPVCENKPLCALGWQVLAGSAGQVIPMVRPVFLQGLGKAAGVSGR